MTFQDAIAILVELDYHPKTFHVTDIYKSTNAVAAGEEPVHTKLTEEEIINLAERLSKLKAFL